MTTHEDKVREQSLKFRAELPFLLETHPGKWIVYRDGLQYVGDSHDEAHGWALAEYGIDGWFVIAQVVAREPIQAWKLGGIGASAVYEQQLSELKTENARLRQAIVEAVQEMERGIHLVRDAIDKAVNDDDLGDAALAISAELHETREENARLRALVDATRRLVAALPKCTYCNKPATHAYRRGEERYCLGCAPDNCPPYPRAQPLRDTIAALAKLNT